MKQQQRTLESDKIHFAVMAIESGAKQLGISSMEMHRRLEQADLLQRLILDCYDVMHTQSIRHVAEDIVEALHNWESKELVADANGSDVSSNQ